MVEERLFTVKEVAARLSRNVETIRIWCRNGTLPARKIGFHWFITHSALYGSPGGNNRGTQDNTPSAQA